MPQVNPKPAKGERAVVTGGAGFVGSHLCESLLSLGAEVVCVDNFVTGSPDNVKHLEGKPGYSFIKQDVTEKLEVDGPVRYVFNLASPASPIDYAKLPIETLRVGSLGTENAARLALAKKARFLQASTSEIYGDPIEHPQREHYRGNVDPVGPRSVYDEAKRYGEAMVSALRRSFGLDAAICRIFNTYGPRMRLDDGRVVPAFVAEALEGKDFTVFGDGKQTRSFCYVSDLVRGIILLAQSKQFGPLNLGNPREMTVLEFAEAVRNAAGGGGKIVFKPLPEGDPLRRRPDIRRAWELLGWEPVVGLDEGLKQTIDWFRGKLGK
jgi:dTDP-glucose 4,6-dehydratase